jgi:uncharacterized cupredoxin-like copper-binding protein
VPIRGGSPTRKVDPLHASRTVVSLAAVSALAIASAGCGNSSSASTHSATSTTKAAAAVHAGQPIAVTLNEWAVKPSSSSVAAGSVTFAVRNTGKVTHELVVLRTTKSADTLGTGSRIAETGHAGETGDIAPGSTKRVTIKLAVGHYSLVCNLPGHFMSGMHTDFNVT